MDMTDPYEEALALRMQALGIREDDFVEKFVLGRGHGGQKLNKTASCVSLRHRPSGLRVKCQKSRSRTVNRYLARQWICDQLERARKESQREVEQAVEKARRRNRTPSEAARARAVEEKRRRSRVKGMRKKPPPDED